MIDKNLFTTDDYESLLAYDDNGEINTSLKSLLNFENINFIIQNANNTNNINK